jgi:LAO/AO transport system kinase
LFTLYVHTDKAYAIGIAGASGVGKKTWVDQRVTQLRKEGKTVGVLAVDLASPFRRGRRPW